MMHVTHALNDASFVNRRKAERFSLSLPIGIRTVGQSSVDGTMIDISTSGFRARYAQDLRTGERIWLRMAGQMPVAATVIWSNEGVVGGAFVEPLLPSLVRRLVEADRANPKPAPAVERTPMLVDLLRRTRERGH